MNAAIADQVRELLSKHREPMTSKDIFLECNGIADRIDLMQLLAEASKTGQLTRLGSASGTCYRINPVGPWAQSQPNDRSETHIPLPDGRPIPVNLRLPLQRQVPEKAPIVTSAPAPAAPKPVPARMRPSPMPTGDTVVVERVALTSDGCLIIWAAGVAFEVKFDEAVTLAEMLHGRFYADWRPPV